MTFDSPNSSPNLNPSFHPLITNFAFPSPLPLFINTRHRDLSSDHHHFPLPSSVNETLTVGEMGAPPSNSKTPLPTKKGRHSKIHTSQGLRDRRVRLSIGIARQFFDLQDMLGFDKASKTLDWLFSRSKNAITELARSKHQSDCHVATGQTDSIGSNGDHAVNNNNNNPDNLQGNVSKEEEKKKNISRVRKKNKICCGNPTAMNLSALATASTSTSTSAQKNNNYYFPNLALDWDDTYNTVLPPSSFVVSNMNLSETGFDAQREYTM